MASKRTLALAKASGLDPTRVLEDAVRLIPSRSAEIERPTLEDIFVRIVRDDAGEEART